MYKVVYNASFGGFSLSQEARRLLIEKGLHMWQSLIPRHDKRLIEVVEELGDAANGDFATLKIAVISEDRYLIREYDGLEWVVTPSKINWVEIKEKQQE